MLSSRLPAGDEAADGMQELTTSRSMQDLYHRASSSTAPVPNLDHQDTSYTKRVPQAELWMVPGNYALPRKVVMKCLEEMDAQEQPDKPGMLCRTTLEKMVRRFDRVFNSHINRDDQIESVLDHLQRHTRRRRGESAVKSGLLEWEQTSRVYELFTVQLNLCERALFTMDFTVRSTILSRVCSTVLIFTIFLSIVSWMVSTLPSMKFVLESCTSIEVGQCVPKPFEHFAVIEACCVYLFTFEYLIRLIMVHRVRFELLDAYFVAAILKGTTNRNSSASGIWAALGCPSKPKNKLDGALRTTVKHILGPTNVVDLLAILPFWIEAINTQGKTQGHALVALRMLRLTRIFRVFKLGRYSDAFMLFTRVMEQSAPALSLMTFFILLGCALFGTMVWFAEGGEWYPEGNAVLSALSPPIEGRGAYLRTNGKPWSAPGRPEFDPLEMEETPFESILHAFWFVVVTITTVGYGDIVCKSPAGKLIGTLMILSGVIVLAMPIGVVGANFSREYYRVIEEKKRRQLLKQQLDSQAAVEAEQDALLEEQKQREELLEQNGSPNHAQEAIEIHRRTQARQKLIISAEAIDKAWQDCFEERPYTALSLELRRFMTLLLPQSRSPQDEAVDASAPLVKAFVSKQTLEQLDVLTSKVHTTISAHTSCKELADFNLKHAKLCRWEWALFVDECWQCVLDICRVEEPSEPPQFFELRANMSRDEAIMEAGLKAKIEAERRGGDSMRQPAVVCRFDQRDHHKELEWGSGDKGGGDPRGRSVPGTSWSMSSASTAVGAAPIQALPGDGAAGGPSTVSPEEPIPFLPNMPDSVLK